MTNHSPRNPGDLRRQAEQQARNMDPVSLSALSPDEIQRVFHELRVHQIELELQNEELRTDQAQIEAGRARYFDLYDQAPVGYCTLSEKGLILEANLTAATLLGKARGVLVKQPFSRYILKEDQDIYYLFLKKRCETPSTLRRGSPQAGSTGSPQAGSTGSPQAGEPQECDLRLVRPDDTFIWAHLTATTAQAETDGPVCRVVINDITERKRMEEVLLEERQHLDFIMQATRTNIDVLDADYTLRYVDAAWRKVYGEPDGRKCYRYFMGFDAPCPDCGVPQAMESKQASVYEMHRNGKTTLIGVASS